MWRKDVCGARPGGRAAFIASGPQAPKPDRADVTSLRPPVGRDRGHLERIAELFMAGAVRAPAITLYRLARGGRRPQGERGAPPQGKLVLQVR